MMRLVSLLAYTLLAACATTLGKKIDMAAVATLQEGVATLEDATAIMGPFSSEAMAAGIHTYGWTYSRYDAFTGKMESQAVMLSFDKSGRLMMRSSSKTP